MRRVLEVSGYNCVLAASGAEALVHLEENEIPVVLTDIRMPEMDGVALLGKIRDRWPDVAVLVITAVAEVDVAVACLQMGALDYLTKPFQLKEVKARLEQALEKSRLIRDNRMYQEHLSELVNIQARRIEELFLEGVQVLVEALEAKDAYTRGHSTRVSAYSGRIASELGLSAEDQQFIRLAAELHDVGKIGVRESVLLKPARLDPDEYGHLMQHMDIGARILEPLLKNAPLVIDIVRSHHEHFNGTGLPDALAEDAIPLPARVVSLADAFDAMTSARPYRDAMSPQAAIDEIDRCSGAQFDPAVVDAFHKAYPNHNELPIETPDKVQHRLPEGVAAGSTTSSK